MPAVIRFHLDESVDSRIAAGLRRRGFDVTLPVDVGLRQASDIEHLDDAREHERVLVTSDTDFLRFHTEGIPHAGIVFCAQRARIGRHIDLLACLSECVPHDEMYGHVEYL